jgi:hypothetical protein
MQQLLPYDLFIEIFCFSIKNKKTNNFMPLTCEIFSSLLKKNKKINFILKRPYRKFEYDEFTQKKVIKSIGKPIKFNYNEFEYLISIITKYLFEKKKSLLCYLFHFSIKNNDLKLTKIIVKNNHDAYKFSIDWRCIKLTFTITKWLHENFFIDLSNKHMLFNILISTDYKHIGKILVYCNENNIEINYDNFFLLKGYKDRELKLFDLCYFSKKFLNNPKNFKILKSYETWYLFKYISYIDTCPYLHREINIINICELHKDYNKYSQKGETVVEVKQYHLKMYIFFKLLIENGLCSEKLKDNIEFYVYHNYFWAKYFAKSVLGDKKYEEYNKKYRYEKYTLFDKIEIYTIKIN